MEKNIVAVYGSLLKGLGNHGFLSNAGFIGETIISIPFKMVDLGYFPGLLSQKTPNNISIEVYNVSENEFRALDGLEGYPNFYNRMQIETEFGKAWIYYLNNSRDYKEDLTVESGNWRQYYETKHGNVLS